MIDRNRVIIKTSAVGIAANIFLSAIKAFVGFLTHSIAITLDAVNNLSDALSSVITIIGTKLAGRAPDKEHPLGHGRYEYLTSVIISAIVLSAGVMAIIESMGHIIHPVIPKYNSTMLFLVALAIAVKVVLGIYVKRTGKEVNSPSLVASGLDALFDAVVSSATLIAAIFYLFTGISVEAYLGLIISIIIIKAGIDILRETISQILGERVESELSQGIKKTITEFDDVYGTYDLLLHNYGPDVLVGSVHIEIPDYYTAAQIDALTRKIQKAVFEKYKVIIATVGVYSRNMNDDRASKIRNAITDIVMSQEHVIQMHGFYIDIEEKQIVFDIVIEFCGEREQIYKHIYDEINALYPEYKLNITLDNDLSD